MTSAPEPVPANLSTLPYELLCAIYDAVAAAGEENSVDRPTSSSQVRHCFETAKGRLFVVESQIERNETNSEKRRKAETLARRTLWALMLTCRSCFEPAARTLYSSFPLVIREPAKCLDFLNKPTSMSMALAGPLVKRLRIELPLFAIRSNDSEVAFSAAIFRLLRRLGKLEEIEVAGYGDKGWRDSPYYYGFVPFGVVWTGLWDAICPPTTNSALCARPAYLDSVTRLSLTALSFRPFHFMKATASSFPNLDSLKMEDCDLNAEHFKFVFSGSDSEPTPLKNLKNFTVLTNGLHPTLRTDVHSGLPPFLALPSLKSVKLDNQVLGVAPTLLEGLGSAVESVDIEGDVWEGGRSKAVRAVDWGRVSRLRVGDVVYEKVSGND